MIVRMATPADAAALADLSLKTFVDAFAAANRAEDMEAYTSVAYRKTGFVQCATQPFLIGSDLQTDWVISRTL